MPETVLVVLPLPPRVLSPNVFTGSRGGRMQKAGATKGYRAQASRAAEELGVESGPWQQATVQATFYHRDRRRRDDVNSMAMLKPAYDGLVDAGLLVDDDAAHLTTLPATFAVDREHPRVELRIERIA